MQTNGYPDFVPTLQDIEIDLQSARAALVKSEDESAKAVRDFCGCVKNNVSPLNWPDIEQFSEKKLAISSRIKMMKALIAQLEENKTILLNRA